MLNMSHYTEEDSCNHDLRPLSVPPYFYILPLLLFFAHSSTPSLCPFPLKINFAASTFLGTQLLLEQMYITYSLSNAGLHTWFKSRCGRSAVKVMCLFVGKESFCQLLQPERGWQGVLINISTHVIPLSHLLFLCLQSVIFHDLYVHWRTTSFKCKRCKWKVIHCQSPTVNLMTFSEVMHAVMSLWLQENSLLESFVGCIQ